jgi:polyphosphate kinase
MLNLIAEEHDLTEVDVIPVNGLVDLTCLWQMHAVDRPDLKDDQW